MPEICFTVPATLLDHGWDDDIRSERALIRRVKVGDLRVFNGIIRRYTNHSATRRIEVNGLSGRICYANEVRRVFEKRHKDLTLIFVLFAPADVADESLPPTVGQDVGVHLDGNVGSVLPNQRPLSAFNLSRRKKLRSSSLQPGRILGRNDVEDCLADELVAIVAEHPAGRLVDVRVTCVKVGQKECLRRKLDEFPSAGHRFRGLFVRATQLIVGALDFLPSLLHPRYQKKHDNRVRSEYERRKHSLKRRITSAR